MTAHLGARVSALLDGQLPAAEAEAAWAHVHTCHTCRDLVEREGWIKTRLAGLAQDEPCPASDRLKGALLGMPPGMPPGDVLLAISQQNLAHRSRGRRAVGIAALGSGAAGAAVMGVLALGTAPADVPNLDRRVPVQQISNTPAPQPSRPGQLPR